MKIKLKALTIVPYKNNKKQRAYPKYSNFWIGSPFYGYRSCFVLERVFELFFLLLVQFINLLIDDLKR